MFAAVLKFFPRLKTSAVHGAASSNKSTPARFAPETQLQMIGIAVLPVPRAIAPNPLPRCRLESLKNVISTCLEAAILKRLFR